MNELMGLLGLNAWKPLLAAWVLPPVPFLLLLLLGARLLYWRRGLAWLVMLLAAAGLWLSESVAVGQWLQTHWLRVPAPLDAAGVAELRRASAASSPRKVAIVVLGGGRQAHAPEFDLSNLTPQSLARLHYGLHLARQTGAPVLFSGGVGWGQEMGPSEADAAARIAERDFGRPLKWVEGQSRDTRENATHSLSMLKPAGITDLVLVTHGWHMPRALRAFEAERQRQGMEGLRIVPAPMGLADHGQRLGDWMPSSPGAVLVRQVLREKLGYWFGA